MNPTDVVIGLCLLAAGIIGLLWGAPWNDSNDSGSGS
jgi:hypothetical protein